VSDLVRCCRAASRPPALHCGIRARRNKLDLALIVGDAAFPAAAIFTKNQLIGAHVTLCRESLKKSNGKVRALLVNSGNANCSTGEEGLEDARTIQGASPSSSDVRPNKCCS
jgi:glutamate N-acetyltransferase/amino-acid N-acetyltransferase